MSKTLTRRVHNKVIAGVCGGLADKFGINVTLVRLAFLLSMLLPGPQVLIYLVLWLVLPTRY